MKMAGHRAKINICSAIDEKKSKENWVEYRTTCETLKKEKILFLANVEPYAVDDKSRFKNLVQRVESIISKENTNWAYYIAQEKEKKTSK